MKVAGHGSGIDTETRVTPQQEEENDSENRESPR